MAILTCITPEAEDSARHHARLGELKAQLIKIEEDQSFVLLSSFPDRRFFNKRLGRDFRILFSRHMQREYTLLCVFAFLSRGDGEYDRLWHTIRIGHADDLYNSIDNKNQSAFAERIAEFEHNPEPPSPPEPDEREALWLTSGGRLSQQVIVLETEAWMSAQAEEHFYRSGNAIYRLLQDQVYAAVDAFHKSGSQPQYEPVIPYLEPGYLDGEDFRIHLQYFPAYHILFLFDLTKPDVTQPAISFNTDIERQTLIKNACRAYPLDVFLLESDEFSKIQRQQEGNLALSPEESDILDRINGPEINRFPLFINGRAGSGKSTILQYLLKDYLYLSIENSDPEVKYTPLYLTYSKKLLDVAKNHVGNLLSANAELLLKRKERWQQCYISHKEEIFKSTFKLFREFLIELLPEESLRNFLPEHRIGYTQFKKLWAQTAAKNPVLHRRYSVDLVWHVLRTYIKGMAHETAENYFTPTDYKTLSRKHKTVSDEVFTDIYEKLWENWYQSHCEETESWDDQDLALAVLAEASFPQTYPAIFCDEAQDFTAIELKILYHLSLFSERSVPAYDIKNIPFVFAGDPLQTLNPTGFRWEAVKSSFHNYLLVPIERRARSKSGFNYQELLANYRSSKKIVGFCNYIQLLRLCLFGDSYGIQPQTAWFARSDGMPPFLYSINAPKSEELLRDNSVVIIPDCHEDEEIEYVDNDRLLGRTVERDEKGIPSTVLSPNMAKGLEYDQIVVLYRFGATCPKSLLQYLQGNGPEDPGPAVTIEWEYFLNRLYVAASRARQKLVILDEPETFRSFWGLDMDAEQLVRHFGAKVDPQNWGGDRVVVPREGTDDDMDNMRSDRQAADDSKELAYRWYREGLDLENSHLLRRARMLYQHLGMEAKAKECLAHALRFEGNYSEAAKVYQEIDLYELVLDCLWTVAEFTEIAKVIWRDDLCHDLRVELASKLRTQNNSTSWQGNLTDTERTLRRLETALTDKQIRDEAHQGWSGAIVALLDGVRKSEEVATGLSHHWNTLRVLAERFRYPRESLAMIAYKLQRFNEARSLWEESGKTGTQDYYQCVYKTSTWPETLRPLKQLRNFKQVIKDWQGQSEAINGLDESLAVILVEALIEENQLARAVNLLSRQRLVTNPQALKPLTQQLWRKRDTLVSQSPDDTRETASCLLHALIETRTWDALSSVLDDTDNLVGRLSEIYRHEIDQALVEHLAYSEVLRGTSGEFLDILSKLLRDRFWRKDDRWLPIIERGINVPLTGAAIERANRISDAIDFYNWAGRLPGLQSRQRRYFDERLAGCMQKMVDWRQSQGKDAEEERRRLQDLKRRLGLEMVEVEPNPDQYPGDGILPRRLVEVIKHPPSQAESEAKEKLEQEDSGRNEAGWKEALETYVKILAENDRWHALTQDWCQNEAFQQRYPNLTPTQLEAALDVVVQAIVEPLSSAVAVTNSSLNVQQILSSLLVGRLRDNEADNTWTGCARLKIDHDVVGAAIERLGRHIDAIQFYEWALTKQATRFGRKAMAERLIVVRERYATYLQDSYPDRADGQRRRARELREQFQLLNAQISEYPEI